MMWNSPRPYPQQTCNGTIPVNTTQQHTEENWSMLQYNQDILDTHEETTGHTSRSLNFDGDSTQDKSDVSASNISTEEVL